MTKATKQTEEQLKKSIVAQVIKASQLPDPDHTLIHIKDDHYKFYQIKVIKANVWINYGKIGTSGTASSKAYGSNIDAIGQASKLLREKLAKGYEEPDGTDLEEEIQKVKSKRAAKKMTPEGLDKLDAFLNTLK